MSTNGTMRPNHSSLSFPLLRVGEGATAVGGQTQAKKWHGMAWHGMRCADMASGSSNAHRTATWAEQVGVDYSAMPVMGVGKASCVVDCDLWN